MLGPNNCNSVIPGSGQIRQATRHGCPSLLAAATGCLMISLPTLALANAVPPLVAPPLVDLSLEELGDLRVTSVSRKEQRLADAAAAIHVITAEAIRRSGARTLPEALRLAPNLLVAQITSNTWAISARGFNSSTANKLLVMIDGRTIYTPLYSGVFWDVQDVLLDDVERIEVISGTGGTLWGANAVNGVINVISKKASASSGELVQTGVGNSGRGLAIRHGATSLDQRHAYRIYAKLDQGDHSTRSNGNPANDAWNRRQLGFRSDWQLGHSELTLQGDAYHLDTDQANPGRQRSSGSNLLLRWSQHQADGSGLRVQTYLDRTARDIPGTFSERLATLDLDVQYTLPETGGSQTVFGGGYRMARDQLANSSALAFLPPRHSLRWANLFIQHERSLSDNWRLTAGTKLERNDYSGVEYLPSLKLAWKVVPEQLLWASLSRSVRAPSRIDTDLYIPGKPPYLLAGGPDFQSEIGQGIELGWRGQRGSDFSWSLVLAHTEYQHLRSVDQQANGVYLLANHIAGREAAIEASGRYQLDPDLALEASLLLLHGRFFADNTNLNLARPGNDPRAQVQVGVRWNPAAGQELDLNARYVASLPRPAVPAYTVLDLRYGYQLGKHANLALAGKNLLNRNHQEFATQNSTTLAGNRIEFGRSLELTLTLRY